MTIGGGLRPTHAAATQDAMAYVTIRIKGADGHSFNELTKDRMVLGRSSRTDLPIKHTSISREHCAFVREQDVWFVEDLGSSNGTWVNKDKVNGRQQLGERDIVKVGHARLTFHAGERGAGDEAAVDIGLDDDPAEVAAGPVRTSGSDDPPEAIPCAHCQGWFSIAHRSSGDAMDCPRCGKPNTVPSMAI
jgi:hypothetical protein